MNALALTDRRPAPRGAGRAATARGYVLVVDSVNVSNRLSGVAPATGAIAVLRLNQAVGDNAGWVNEHRDALGRKVVMHG